MVRKMQILSGSVCDTELIIKTAQNFVQSDSAS